MDQQVLQHIVEQAARAPSVHNTQPWRFVARGDVLEVWTDPDRALPVLDPAGRARHLSCGAALLHARVAAAAAGFATEVSLLPDPARPDHLADLDLRAGDATADGELAGAIAARHTTRAAFGPEPLSAEVVAALHRAAEAEGAWLRIADTPADAVALAVLMARADEVQSADPAYRDELRRWTGRGVDAADGVPASAVPEPPPAARGSNYRLRDFVTDRDDVTPAPGPGAEPPAVERPLVAVLGTTDDDVAAWLAAGQATARLLLTATSLGVAASPMTQPLEVPETRARLAAELGVVGHPQMVLRLGHAAGGEAPPATPRRPVTEILTYGDA
jgi:hypothetical protein